MASSEQEKQEFEDLYCRYAPVVERFAVALVKDASVAEDIYQNVSLNLWNRRRNLPGKDNNYYSAQPLSFGARFGIRCDL